MAPKRRRPGDDEDAGRSRSRTAAKADGSAPEQPGLPEWIVGRRFLMRLLGRSDWQSGTVRAIRGLDKRSLELLVHADPDDPDDAGRTQRVSTDTQPVHVAEDIVWAIEPQAEGGKASAGAGERTPALLFRPFGPPEVESCGPKSGRDGVRVGSAAFSGRVHEGEFVEVEVAEPSGNLTWKPGEVRQVRASGNFTCCVNGDEDFVEEYGAKDEGVEWRKVADQGSARATFEAAAKAAMAAGVQLMLLEYVGSKRHGFVSRVDTLPFVKQMWRRKSSPGQIPLVKEALELRKQMLAGALAGMRKALVGKRIAVYWPDDDAWYCGSVQTYEKNDAKWEVLYDDGVQEALDLPKESVHVFFEPTEESDFYAYSQQGHCFLCGSAGQLARVLSAEEAAAAAVKASAAGTEAEASASEPADATDVDGSPADDKDAEALAAPAPPEAPAVPCAGDMLQCGGCRDRFHFGCLDVSLKAKPEKWGKWKCIECKACEVCAQDGTKIRLAVCEDCDAGYHICCLDPPLKSFPHRNFKCPHCVKCASCGTREAKKWTPDYSMCEPCGRLYKDRRYCPICISVYKGSDVDMVQCDKCRFWVHARCDGLDGSGLARLQTSEDSYACPNCRGERTYTLMAQVLEQLQKEDRERFFAVPVTVEYALATQYHSVVDQPMDFKTIRTKVGERQYGDVQLEAVSAFRVDFRLICTNAKAFHRPNEKIHLVAKRLLKFGEKIIDTTFPWLKADLAGDGEGGGPEGGKAERTKDEELMDAAEDAPPLLESPWHHAASVAFESDEAPVCEGSCFVCGGLANEISPWLCDARLLRCTHCAETFHAYCTPPPCPEPNEETLVHWACPRCRALSAPPGKPSDALAAPGAPAPGIARCARCDKPVQRKTLAGSDAAAPDAGVVICADCRCCEGCGTRSGKGWSEDGVWCSSCAPAGLEERFCGVCSRVFDNDSEEASMMIQCDTCLLWVHPLCDGMDEEIYYQYAEGRPGFEKYECPDCSAEPPRSSAVLWRQLERLISRIQHKRLHFSAELLPKQGPERSALDDPRRRASLARWIRERASTGARWAIAALAEDTNGFLVEPIAAPAKLSSNAKMAKDGYMISGTPADDCGRCAFCKDKSKFGGLNVMKKPCLARRVIKGVEPQLAAHGLLLDPPALADGSAESESPGGNGHSAQAAQAAPPLITPASSGEAAANGPDSPDPPVGAGRDSLDDEAATSAVSWGGAQAGAQALPTPKAGGAADSGADVADWESDHLFQEYSSEDDDDAGSAIARARPKAPAPLRVGSVVVASHLSADNGASAATALHGLAAAADGWTGAVSPPRLVSGDAPAPSGAAAATLSEAAAAAAAAADGAGAAGGAAAVEEAKGGAAAAEGAASGSKAAAEAEADMEVASVAATLEATRARAGAGAEALPESRARPLPADLVSPPWREFATAGGEAGGGAAEDPRAAVAAAADEMAVEPVREHAADSAADSATDMEVEVEVEATPRKPEIAMRPAGASAGLDAAGSSDPSADCWLDMPNNAVPAAGCACIFCARGADGICGRLIPAAPGCWAHVNCAMWSSEVFEKEVGVLSNMSSAMRGAKKKHCAHCGLPGASIGCFSKKCLTTHHFACARAARVAYTPDDGRSTWCTLHAPPKALTPLPVRVPRSIAVQRSLRMHKAGETEGQLAAAAESNGRVLLRVGELRVIALGRPQPARPQFHERDQIFPLGFTSKRRFHDLARLPPATCDYTCKIREHAGLPSFVIAHPTDASLMFKGGTAAQAWQALVARRARVHGVRPLHLSPVQARLEGALFFGLAVPAVAQLVEQLPGAKACEGFQPRYSQPEALQKVPPLPKSANGCARADPYVKRTSAYKSAHSVYHRPFINRGAIQQNKERDEAIEAEGREGVLLRRREGENKTAGQLAAATSISALQRLLYNVKVGRSPIHNWGLFTTCAIPKDAMVVEYKGEAMRNVLADLKEKKYGEGALKGQGGDCYMFRLDDNTVLDATMKGNVARFMNHCCHPNCYSKVIEVQDDRGPASVKRKHIVIFAQRDLFAGEEVMYDYKFGVEKEKIVCNCGHPKCLGVMN